MVQKTISRMFQAVLEDSRQAGELRDLLIDTGRENQRPVVHIGNQEYRIGFVDNKPMLVNVSTKALIDPATVSNEVTGISFLTNAKSSVPGVGIPGQEGQHASGKRQTQDA